MILLLFVASQAADSAQIPALPKAPAPEEHTPLGSLISRPVPGQEADTLEFRQAAVHVQKLSRCLVKYSAKGAAAIVEPPHFVGGKDRDLALGRSRALLSGCLGLEASPGTGLKLTMSPPIFIGALAEQLYRKRFAALPALAKVAIPAPRDPSERDDAVMFKLADCVIDRNPGSADALLRTDVTSAEESAGFAALATDLSECIEEGAILSAKRLTLRTAIADRLYRRALAAATKQSRTDRARSRTGREVVDA
jgi:hypothetical protein